MTASAKLDTWTVIGGAEPSDELLDLLAEILLESADDQEGD